MSTEDKQGDYAPRPGTKIALAIQALLDGPMTPSALGEVMRAASNSVGQMLAVPIRCGHIVKLQDQVGRIHYALSSVPADPERFSACVAAPPRPPRPAPPPAHAPYARSTLPNPNDPFGIVEKTTAAGARVVLRPAARPALDSAAPVSPVAPEHPVAGEPFVAALFSTGELMITVGANTVHLSREHQEQLRQYVSRFKEVGAPAGKF